MASSLKLNIQVGTRHVLVLQVQLAAQAELVRDQVAEIGRAAFRWRTELSDREGKYLACKATFEDKPEIVLDCTEYYSV